MLTTPVRALDLPRSDLLCWVDLETTGLEPETGSILELGIAFTDSDLNELFARNWVVHYFGDALDRVDHQLRQNPKVLDMHTKNGLIQELLDPRVSLPLQEVEDFALGYAREYSVVGTAPMCGNTISFDRGWLRKHLPRLHEHLHYRNLDVSTVKRLAAMWWPDVPEAPKVNEHRALADVRESITELRYWRQQWLGVPTREVA